MAGAPDREVREALEQVQMELRAARLSLQTVGEDSARAQGALEDAIAAATLARDASAARLSALTEEQRHLSRRLKELGPRLRAKREEDELLARGAELRDKYVDWNPGDHRDQVDDRYSPDDVKGIAIIVTFSVLIILILLGLR